jgi:hypothetical protein
MPKRLKLYAIIQAAADRLDQFYQKNLRAN